MVPLNGASMTHTRILVVDDNPNLSALVRVHLEKTQRFEVREENRSARALGAAREFLPDMILMDVDMPGKDGGQVALEIQADAGLCDIPILFFTSLISQEEAGTRVIRRGGRLYLAKPLHAKALVDAIDSILTGPVAAA
jgi:DNA-binding response OmpR family regulator